MSDTKRKPKKANKEPTLSRKTERFLDQAYVDFVKFKSWAPDDVIVIRIGHEYGAFGEDAEKVIQTEMLPPYTLRCPYATSVEFVEIPYESASEHVYRISMAGLTVLVVDHDENVDWGTGLANRKVVDIVTANYPKLDAAGPRSQLQRAKNERAIHAEILGIGPIEREEEMAGLRYVPPEAS